MKTFYDDIAGNELSGDVKAYVAVLNKTWLELTVIFFAEDNSTSINEE